MNTNTSFKHWIIIKLPTENIDDKTPIECISRMIHTNNDYSIVYKETIDKTYALCMTYYKDTLIRGFLYKDGVEYTINNMTLFLSLQIKGQCYDKIGICHYEV